MTFKDSFDDLGSSIFDEAEERLKSIPIIELKGVSIIIEVKNIIDKLKSKIIFIVENELKPWKNPGQVSIPFGTIENGESPLEAAVRESYEEAGETIDKKEFKEKGEIDMYVIAKEVTYKLKITVFHILLGKEPILKNDNPEEIREILVMEEGDLNNINTEEIRPGTMESLEILKGNYVSNTIYVKDGKYV